MFQEFPYTDMHQLNLDWIIKIAKDFLDQYTHIQELISNGEESLQNLTTEGLQQLQEKADNLEALLQTWYDTHSQDIADQLADALEDLNEWYNTHIQAIADELSEAVNSLSSAATDAISDFNTAADTKAAETIASIPDDYTALSNTVTKLISELYKSQQTIATIIPHEKHIINFPSQISSDAFDLADENGNTIVKMDYAGNFITKNFESDRSPQIHSLYSAIPYNMAIYDENGNIAFAILKGIALTNQMLSGKKISIIGDSISTFDGYIPSGYATYYPRGNLDDVRETWWYQLCEELNMTLLKNASWSGSTVSGNSQGTAETACSDARIADIKGAGNVNPDIIICYIGTNDWAGNIAVGDFTDKDTIPAEGIITNISDAYALMLYKIRTTYPGAIVYCVTCLEGRQTADTTYPIVNTRGETIYDVNTAIKKIAGIFGCKIVDLTSSGIHYWNIANHTIDGTLHPNVDGARVIKDSIKQKLINTFHNIL